MQLCYRAACCDAVSLQSSTSSSNRHGLLIWGQSTFLWAHSMNTCSNIKHMQQQALIAAYLALGPNLSERMIRLPSKSNL